MMSSYFLKKIPKNSKGIQLQDHHGCPGCESLTVNSASYLVNINSDEEVNASFFCVVIRLGCKDSD